MEPPTKVETCSNCGEPFRIPSDKHIIATCPRCKCKYEYKNGEKVAKAKKRDLIPFYVILFAVATFVIWLVSPDPKQDYPHLDNLGNSAVPASSTYGDTFPTAPSVQLKDSTELLLDKLEEDISDELLDILKDILEQILDGIKEEAERGNWEKADEWFERATDIMSKGGKNGKALLELYKGKLAQAKNDIISKNPNANDLPGAELSEEDKTEGTHATEKVTNNTMYTLTLYYSGLTKTIVTVPPGATETVSLVKGSYNIVAKVSNPSVGEYYGTQTYRGLSYNVTYYIETKAY